MLTRILRIGLLFALAAQIAWSFRPVLGRAETDQEALGRQLFQASCTTCHGVDARGTASGPSLEGVGSAAVDFFLSTGRMPLANPQDQPVRQAPAFSAEEIAAIVAYLRTIAPGGPAIPSVTGTGALPLGQQQAFELRLTAPHIDHEQTERPEDRGDQARGREPLGALHRQALGGFTASNPSGGSPG